MTDDDLEVHEAQGVRWAYIEDYDPVTHPGAKECAECDRHFVATAHFHEGGGADYCPSCEPVESMAHAVERVLNDTPRRPRRIDVGELMDCGDPR